MKAGPIGSVQQTGSVAACWPVRRLPALRRGLCVGGGAVSVLAGPRRDAAQRAHRQPRSLRELLGLLGHLLQSSARVRRAISDGGRGRGGWGDLTAANFCSVDVPISFCWLLSGLKASKTSVN